MLSYWILRDAKGGPIGLVRRENERVSLQLHTPVTADWTVFSETGAAPIAPQGETVLPDAVAVLGLCDGRIAGFAAAKEALPAACYRARVSQICTKKEPPEPQQESSEPQPEPLEPPSEPSAPPEPEMPEEPAVFAGPEPVDSVDESAERAAQFSLLLSRADAFYAQFDAPAVVPADNMVQKEDRPAGGIDLFPQVFARARWRYVDGADVLPHYEGLWIRPDGERVRILAVRGRAAPRPPRALTGFTRYLRGADGNGYWVRTE